jgi:hypothetical protein
MRSVWPSLTDEISHVAGVDGDRERARQPRAASTQWCRRPERRAPCPSAISDLVLSRLCNPLQPDLGDMPVERAPIGSVTLTVMACQ